MAFSNLEFAEKGDQLRIPIQEFENPQSLSRFDIMEREAADT